MAVREFSPRNRLGCFYIMARALETPDGLQGLFYDMVVLRAEPQFNRDAVRYTAWHPSFAPLEEGNIVPEYVAEFRDGETVPTWRRASGVKDAPPDTPRNNPPPATRRPV